MSKCECGNEAVDNLIVTNKQGGELVILFCEEHQGEVEKAIQMLYGAGMSEL